MSVGLKRGTVKVVSYDHSWAAYFEAKKKTLLELLEEDNLVSIEHVGSTSIPTLSAKPIIDILVVVKNLKEAKEWVPKLKTLGFQFKTENDARRLFFTEGPESKRTVHLHIAQQGSEYADEILVFRDYLLKNPSSVREYELLKTKLSGKYANNREAYTKAKEEFVKKIVDKAKSGKTEGEL